MATVFTHLNTIGSALLGITLTLRFVTAPDDYRLTRDAFVSKRSLSIITRFAYIVARYLALSYFVVIVVMNNAPMSINCLAITFYGELVFFLSHLLSHWLFASRLLAIWYTHEKRTYMYVYVFTVYAGLVAISTGNFVFTGRGANIPNFGCLLLLRRVIMPRKEWVMAICICGLSFHTLNMLLALVRLSTFREYAAGESIDDRKVAWRRLLQTCKSVVRRRGDQRFTLAQDLIDQGAHYWIARTLLVFTLIFLPDYAFVDDPLVVTSCFMFFTALDSELAGAIYRATIKAGNRTTAGPIQSLVNNARNNHLQSIHIASIQLTAQFDQGEQRSSSREGGTNEDACVALGSSLRNARHTSSSPRDHCASDLVLPLSHPDDDEKEEQTKHEPQ